MWTGARLPAPPVTKRAERKPVQGRHWFDHLDEARPLLVAIIRQAVCDAQVGDESAAQFLTHFAPELDKPTGKTKRGMIN